VVRELAEQGIDYRKLGREEFIVACGSGRKRAEGRSRSRMKQIGESCDWSREKFTLSPELSRVVRMVFVQLYEARADLPRALHDELVSGVLDGAERFGSVARRAGGASVAYPLSGVGTNEHIVVATTRPETMLGDTAVAVHPEDERYKHLVGKRVLLPLMEREIPIIADEMVDREFAPAR